MESAQRGVKYYACLVLSSVLSCSLGTGSCSCWFLKLFLQQTLAEINLNETKFWKKIYLCGLERENGMEPGNPGKKNKKRLTWKVLASERYWAEQLWQRQPLPERLLGTWVPPYNAVCSNVMAVDTQGWWSQLCGHSHGCNLSAGADVAEVFCSAPKAQAVLSSVEIGKWSWLGNSPGTPDTTQNCLSFQLPISKCLLFRDVHFLGTTRVTLSQFI